MNIKKHLSEKWFTILMLGLKTVEGRLNKGDFKLRREHNNIL